MPRSVLLAISWQSVSTRGGSGVLERGKDLYQELNQAFTLHILFRQSCNIVPYNMISEAANLFRIIMGMKLDCTAI